MSHNEFRHMDALEYAAAWSSCEGLDVPAIEAKARVLNERMASLERSGIPIPTYLLAAYRGFEAAILLRQRPHLFNSPHPFIVKVNDSPKATHKEMVAVLAELYGDEVITEPESFRDLAWSLLAAGAIPTRKSAVLALLQRYYPVKIKGTHAVRISPKKGARCFYTGEELVEGDAYRLYYANEPQEQASGGLLRAAHFNLDTTSVAAVEPQGKKISSRELLDFAARIVDREGDEFHESPDYDLVEDGITMAHFDQAAALLQELATKHIEPTGAVERLQDILASIYDDRPEHMRELATRLAGDKVKPEREAVLEALRHFYGSFRRGDWVWHGGFLALVTEVQNTQAMVIQVEDTEGQPAPATEPLTAITGDEWEGLSSEMAELIALQDQRWLKK